MNWFGSRRVTDQALDWPRSGLFDVAVDEVPPEVRHATAEMALIALTADLHPPLERGGLVKNERIGPLETEYADGAGGCTRYPAVENAVHRIRGRFARWALARRPLCETLRLTIDGGPSRAATGLRYDEIPNAN